MDAITLNDLALMAILGGAFILIVLFVFIAILALDAGLAWLMGERLNDYTHWF